MSNFNNINFENNFRLNLWLSKVIDTYLDVHTRELDWDYISPELKEKINKISHALRDASSLSDRECKKYEQEENIK